MIAIEGNFIPLDLGDDHNLFALLAIMGGFQLHSLLKFIPSLDLIRMPAPESFRSVDGFLATKAHEMLHWTGASSRLGREFGKRFGDQAYAFEELVAEIGAAAMGLKIGLPPQMLDDHASYLAHWVKILKSRPSALLEASGHAQRAVDHLLAYSQPGRQIESEIEEAA